MTVRARIGDLPVWDVETVEIVKGNYPNSNREYIRIRINPRGDLLSDVELNLYSKGDTFPEENITIKEFSGLVNGAYHVFKSTKKE